MKKINFRIIILIVFIICIYLLKKTMFIKGDIFYYQMVSVVEGEKYFLAKIHLVRFLAIFPFYLSTYLPEKISILIQGVVIYFYAKPVLKLQNLNTYILIILVLLLFSYRTSIVALSLPYFHMYQKSKKKKYLFFCQSCKNNRIKYMNMISTYYYRLTIFKIFNSINSYSVNYFYKNRNYPK